MKENGLHQLTREIVANMGFEWSYAADQRDHRAYIAGPDGSGIGIGCSNGFEFKPKGRLEIHGVWPEPVNVRGQWSFYPRERLEITCAASKDPRIIARDILRRFVPKYLPLYYEQAELKAQHLAHCARMDVLEKQLCAFAGFEQDTYKKGVRFGWNGPHLPSGRAEVSSYEDVETVHIDVRGVPFATALEVIALLEKATLEGVKS